jgi:hypothetical protein
MNVLNLSFPFKLTVVSRESVRTRVSFETSFESKQPKLKPKLVLALSETKRLFRLFRFYTKTESFGVSIEAKQTEEQPKQLIDSIFSCFFTKFRVVLVCFGLFWNSLFRFYTETKSFNVSIEPEQREDQLKRFDREHSFVFFRKYMVVSVCFKTVLFVSVVSIYVRNTETNQIFLFLVSRNKPKHNRNKSCFGLFRFELNYLFVSRTP